MPDAPTLILLPGLDGSGQMFGAFERQLPGHWKRLVVRYAQDMPATHDAYLEHVLLQLPPAGPLLVVAESFSSSVAVRLAHHLADRLAGLVLCAGFVSPPHALLPLVRRIPAMCFPMAVRVRPLLKHFCLDSRTDANVLDELQATLGSLNGDTALQRLRILASLDVRREWRELPVPSLALLASRDRLVDRTAQRVLEHSAGPRARMVTVDGPHFLLQARPAECWATIRRWLDEQPLAAAWQQN